MKGVSIVVIALLFVCVFIYAGFGTTALVRQEVEYQELGNTVYSLQSGINPILDFFNNIYDKTESLLKDLNLLPDKIQLYLVTFSINDGTTQATQRVILYGWENEGTSQFSVDNRNSYLIYAYEPSSSGNFGIPSTMEYRGAYYYSWFSNVAGNCCLIQTDDVRAQGRTIIPLSYLSDDVFQGPFYFNTYSLDYYTVTSVSLFDMDDWDDYNFVLVTPD